MASKDRKSIYWFYYILAGINVLTVLATLGLATTIQHTYKKLFEQNETWLEIINKIDHVTTLSVQSNALGNDVFVKLDVHEKEKIFEEVTGNFKKDLKEFQDWLDVNFEFSSRDLEKYLVKADQHFQNAHDSTHKIFELINQDRMSEATQQMALTNDQFHVVLLNLKLGQSEILSLQKKDMLSFHDRAFFYFLAEIAVAALVVVMIIAVLFYGKKLRREFELIEKKEKEINDYHLTQKLFYENILNTMTEGFFIQDQDKKIIHANHAASSILGINSIDLIGKTSMDPRSACVKPDGSPFSADQHPGILCLATGAPQRDVVMGVGKAGGMTTWVQVDAVPIALKAEKESKGVLVTLVDITQEVIKSKKLAETSKLLSLSQMSGGVAHEINNPLGIISGMVGLLPKNVNDPEKFSAKINSIQESIARIAKVVSGLRKFSRNASTKNRQSLVVSEIVKECVSQLEVKAKRYQVSLSSELKSEASVNGDMEELKQVVTHLIDNALDAAKSLPQKWVKVNLFDENKNEENEKIILRVTDSGAGIPENVLENLFDPFYTTKPIEEGTGLGLSIVRGIVHDHGGSVDVVKDSPNTCFEVKLRKEKVSQEPIQSEEIKVEETKAEEVKPEEQKSEEQKPEEVPNAT